ncbi:hypothetical protein GCM10017562_72980 [Streptomyces roseofulvus]
MAGGLRGALTRLLHRTSRCTLRCQAASLQAADGARTDPTAGLRRLKKAGDYALGHQDKAPWQCLVDRLMEVVRDARAWAVHAAASPARST